LLGHILDLSGDSRFQVDPLTLAYGQFIYDKATLDPLIPPDSLVQPADTVDKGLYSGYPHREFFIEVQKSFFNDPLHPTNANYKNFLTVFAFGDVNWVKDVDGEGQNVGVKNVTLYPRDPLAAFTLNHEVYHALGLHHTHRDPSIIPPEQKYIYPNATELPSVFEDQRKATDNIMSYNLNGAVTLWNWQLEIVNK
jgi:hypothetical protein